MIKFMVDSGSDYDVNEAKRKKELHLFLCQLLLIMIHIKMELK